MAAGGIVGSTRTERKVELKHKFVFRVDDVGSAKWSKMGELKFTWEKVEVWEGGADTPVKVKGRKTYEPVELTRMAGLNEDMYRWAQAGSDDKRTGTLEQLDTDDSVLKRWHIEAAWLSDFTTGDWDNEAGEGRATVATMEMDKWDLVFEA